MRGKLELPVGVESMNAMAAVAANAKFVVFAGEDSSDLIVRSADDLRVLDVLDCGSVNEITICCQNVVAIANGNRDGLVQLMSLDVPTAQLTINVDDDVCALAGDPTALIVRGFLAIHTWRVEVFGARLFAQPLAQFEMRIALRTRAVTWAPPLGESEDTDILVTVQRQKSDPCVIWRLFIDEDAEGGPALTHARRRRDDDGLLSLHALHARGFQRPDGLRARSTGPRLRRGPRVLVRISPREIDQLAGEAQRRAI